MYGAPNTETQLCMLWYDRCTVYTLFLDHWSVRCFTVLYAKVWRSSWPRNILHEIYNSHKSTFLKNTETNQLNLCFILMDLFSYASSSTLHPRQRVSESVSRSFGLGSVAWSLRACWGSDGPNSIGSYLPHILMKTWDTFDFPVGGHFGHSTGWFWPQ